MRRGYDDVENAKNLVVFLLMMFPERLLMN